MKALRDFSQGIRREKPKNIDEWQEMFRAVFDANLKHLSLGDIALHLMEELGEASDAMVRMYTYKQDKLLKEEVSRRQLRLEAELADLFSWLFAVVGKVNILKQESFEYERWRTETTSHPPQPIYLSQVIWRRYGSAKRRSFYCRFCNSLVCSCKLIFVRADSCIEESATK